MATEQSSVPSAPARPLTELSENELRLALLSAAPVPTEPSKNEIGLAFLEELSKGLATPKAIDDQMMAMEGFRTTPRTACLMTDEIRRALDKPTLNPITLTNGIRILVVGRRKIEVRVATGEVWELGRRTPCSITPEIEAALSNPPAPDAESGNINLVFSGHKVEVQVRTFKAEEYGASALPVVEQAAISSLVRPAEEKSQQVGGGYLNALTIARSALDAQSAALAYKKRFETRSQDQRQAEAKPFDKKADELLQAHTNHTKKARAYRVQAVKDLMTLAQGKGISPFTRTADGRIAAAPAFLELLTAEIDRLKPLSAEERAQADATARPGTEANALLRASIQVELDRRSSRRRLGMLLGAFGVMMLATVGTLMGLGILPTSGIINMSALTVSGFEAHPAALFSPLLAVALIMAVSGVVLFKKATGTVSAVNPPNNRKKLLGILLGIFGLAMLAAVGALMGFGILPTSGIIKMSALTISGFEAHPAVLFSSLLAVGFIIAVSGAVVFKKTTGTASTVDPSVNETPASGSAPAAASAALELSAPAPKPRARRASDPVLTLPSVSASRPRTFSVPVDRSTSVPVDRSTYALLPAGDGMPAPSPGPDGPEDLDGVDLAAASRRSSSPSVPPTLPPTPPTSGSHTFLSGPSGSVGSGGAHSCGDNSSGDQFTAVAQPESATP